MIVRLSGVLLECAENFCVIDVAGVGYGVSVPASTARQLPAPGEPVALWTYQYVREDTLALYGFWTRDERKAFETMLSASGIGPRVALAMLSTYSLAALAAAIIQGDGATLARIPGIGKRTAEKIILELKPKMKAFAGAGHVPGPGGAAAPVGGGGGPVEDQAIQALMALGASLSEAQARVQDAVSRLGQIDSLEQLLTAAMRSAR